MTTNNTELMSNNSQNSKLFNRLKRLVLKRLQQPDTEYYQRVYNNLENLYQHIRKGDVVLVEGRTRLSKIIKLFSISHWSHVAMYVGDTLIADSCKDRQKYIDKFGDDAHHLVIEAYSGEGVVAAPLKKYIEHNIRVCRPYEITKDDLNRAISHVINSLGKQYDQQNIIDLALIVLPDWLNLMNNHTIRSRLGSNDEFKVICSGMIARAFHSVGYPIVPVLDRHDHEEHHTHEVAYGDGMLVRHYTQILPRDFDLSPNFEIIKFNIVENGPFDYHKLKHRFQPADSGARKGYTPEYSENEATQEASDES